MWNGRTYESLKSEIKIEKFKGVKLIYIKGQI